MTLNVGTVLNNRYRVAKLVGQGGFGAVYRAWDLSLLQPVALKENSGGGMEAQRQFERYSAFYQGDVLEPRPLFAREPLRQAA